MPYATREDIETRRGRELLLVIADRDDGGAVDDEAVDAALLDASAKIDSYIGGRYSLPLATTPPLLVHYAVDMAVYYLADRAALNAEEHRKRYEDAISQLEEIRDGKSTLPVDPPAASSDVAQSSTECDQDFTCGGMKRWGPGGPD